MLSEHQKEVIASLPEEKRNFIEKQLKIYKGQGFIWKYAPANDYNFNKVSK